MLEKKILVTQPSLPDYSEYCNEIRNIWDNHYLTNNGPKHQLLESELKNFLNTDNLSLFTNGHLALTLGIKAFNLTGEVITTPFTFVSTVNAIVENNLKPIFCDINPDNYTLDPMEIEKHITKKTTAIIPVHVYGNVCDVEKIEEIAKKNNLKVIYDAAHVFGVKYKNKQISTYGDASMYSFHATKVFNTIEGGAFVYKDPSLYEKLNEFKNFGLDNNGDVLVESINAKMNEFQASMGLCNLRHLKDQIKKREDIYRRYCSNLASLDGIQLNKINQDVDSNYAYFPILVDKTRFGISRDELYLLLKENNIISRKYFYPLITDLNFYKNKYSSKNTPIAKRVSESILCLPIYSNLTFEEVDYICSIIRKGRKI